MTNLTGTNILTPTDCSSQVVVVSGREITVCSGKGGQSFLEINNSDSQGTIPHFLSKSGDYLVIEYLGAFPEIDYGTIDDNRFSFFRIAQVNKTMMEISFRPSTDNEEGNVSIPFEKALLPKSEETLNRIAILISSTGDNLHCILATQTKLFHLYGSSRQEQDSIAERANVRFKIGSKSKIYKISTGTSKCIGSTAVSALQNSSLEFHEVARFNSASENRRLDIIQDLILGNKRVFQ